MIVNVFGGALIVSEKFCAGVESATAVFRRLVQALFIAFALGIWVGIPYLLSLEPPASVLRLTQVEFHHGDFSQRLAHVAAEPVQLPDDWYRSRPELGRGWYRLRAPAVSVADGSPAALYLPSVNMNAAAYVNGRLIGLGGRLRDPVARFWHRPLLLPFASSLLREQGNVVEVFLRADPPGSGLLGPLYLGSERELRGHFSIQLFVKSGLVWGTTIWLAAIGLFIGALWLRRRKDSVYGWFALMVLLWAVHNLNVLIVDIPVSTLLWDWLTRYGCMMWFVIVGVPFTNRYIDAPQPRLECAVIVFGACAWLAALWLEPADFYDAARVVLNPLLLACGGYASLRLLWAHRKHPRPEIVWLFLSSIVVMTFAVHDALSMLQLWSRENGMYLQYGAPLIIFVFAWFLLSRLISALNQTEQLNADLEFRVRQKHLELDASYRSLRDLEQQRALTEERERIMQDMHDGVGGQLVGALVMLERDDVTSGQVRSHLQESLADLRMIIDSLDPELNDVNTLLGMLRHRLQPQLEAAGMNLRWRVTDLPVPTDFGPQKALHLMRILQEAITNSVKHSAGSTVVVVTGCDERRLWVRVEDDGRGPPQNACGGRGLSNIRSRAAAIEAEVSFTSQQGATVELRLPL